MPQTRYKLWKITATGKRTYIGMYWSDESLSAAINKAKLRAGQTVEVQSVDVGDIPHQCKPGSIRETMNGKPIQRRSAHQIDA